MNNIIRMQFSYLLLLIILSIYNVKICSAVNIDENINFLPFERNENTGVSLTLAGEHALENGIIQLQSKRNKKEYPIQQYDTNFQLQQQLHQDFYENENNQHPFDFDLNECGGLYKNFSTLIQTPDYGLKNYEPGLNCEYIIFSPYRCPNEFHIQFLQFQLEYSDNCTKDYLEIGNEPKVCGQVTGIKNYKTEDGVLVINFRSDGTIENKGFKLLITRQPCQDDYTVRKLRQNSSPIIDDKRKNKSLNVKGIANHLLPPFRTKDETINTIDNNKYNNEKITENSNFIINYKENNEGKNAKQYIYSNDFQPYIPGLIPIENNNGYLPPTSPTQNPINQNYPQNYPNYNHNIPLPSNNPLVPPSGNTNEYLPPPDIYSKPEIINNNNIPTTKPTFILGSDNVNLDLPTYHPNCNTNPNPNFYPIAPKPQIPPTINYYPTITNSPPFPSYYPHHIPSYVPQNIPHHPTINQIPCTSYTQVYRNCQTIPAGRTNFPIENNNIPQIPYPFNATSVLYPQGVVSQPAKMQLGSLPINHFGPQVLGFIPTGTLPPCCANIFQEKRFYLSSPGFPHSSNYLTDCLYYIRRYSPNVCRLRIRLLYFSLPNNQNFNGLNSNNLGPYPNNIGPELCLDDFIEIDGQRICGCKTNIEYISQWGLQDKIIRLKLSGRPGSNLGNGFILDIIQEECPIRLQRNVNLPNLITKRMDINSGNILNENTNENDPTFENIETKNDQPIKRQISSIKGPTEGPSSQFFFFSDQQNQCSFTPNDMFKLIIESLWIRKPQCIPVGQTILRV